MDLSVIIPCRNVAGTIGAQLDALAAEEWDGEWEVVLVDNGSTDGTRRVLDRYADRTDRIRVVDAAEGGGVSYARNAGIEAGKADRLAFCDGDDVIGQGWVAAMGTALDAHPYVTGPLELARLNEADAIRSRPGLDRAGPPTFVGTVPFAHSCNLGISRSLAEQHGGFALDLADSADVGLGIRLSSAGVALHFSPAAVVHYRLRTSPVAGWRQARRNNRFYPRLAAEVRRAGFPAPRRTAGLRYWPWLVARANLLSTPSGRARWCFVAGTAVGRVEGSLRSRHVYL